MEQYTSTSSAAEPSLLGKLPAPSLVLMAITVIQVGSALATQLFPMLRPEGTVAVPIISSALLLGFAARSGVQQFPRIFFDNWALLLGFGLCMTAMNLFFFKAIALIPLGTTVTLEFIGPLTVAAFNSRKLSQFAWVALAALGVLLLSPLTGTDVNSLGVVFALLAGSGWAMFIVLAVRVAKCAPGNDGLTIGMIIAALAMVPIAAPLATVFVAEPLLLLAGFAVAVLSTTIPFTFEFEALKRLPHVPVACWLALNPQLPCS